MAAPDEPDMSVEYQRFEVDQTISVRRFLCRKKLVVVIATICGLAIAFIGLSIALAARSYLPQDSAQDLDLFENKHKLAKSDEQQSCNYYI